MIVYAIFFSLGAGVNFIAFTNIHWFSNNLSFEALTIFSSVGTLLISLGIFIGSIIPIQMKIEKLNSNYYKFATYIVWSIMVIFMLRINAGFGSLSGLSFSSDFYTTLEYINAVLLIMAFGISFRIYSLEKNKYLLNFMNGILILILAQVIRLSFLNYAYLYHLLYNLYVLIGYIYLYNTIFGYNILGPIQGLINDEKQIKLYAENLEVIVERRTTEMKNNNLRLIQEIEYAKSIQQSLLPARKVNFNKVTFVSEYYPCERLSGDFFDIYRLDDDNIGMYVLDVSGHGVSAALMTMFCNNYIKSSEKLIMKYRGLKPHRNLKHFYEEFNKMKFPDEMYMVM
ncbi:PP2C family protein-serine/threonine phosphatase, partial [Sphaerochaeta sp. S2]|uniref:PP2C family protein-serine/threonine phosphatase n=1 Tax=Sphaerochaeta sp. S2 TaxID=2798868 RepID=UPI001A20094D|nr:hypothetical protein [Sphaerochaeta sp. S2]